MATALIGTPVNRVDGHQKVTGKAQYAGEVVLSEMAHGVLLSSSKTAGKIRKISTQDAEKSPGVLLVLTHENTEAFGELPNDLMAGGTVGEPRPPLSDNRILHNGQYVAMVVAERMEQARHAAGLIKIDYAAAKFAVALEDAEATRFKPKDFMGNPLNFERGKVAKALKAADVIVDQTYSTPTEHPCALEPHASVASWSGDQLTVYNSTQWVMGDRTVLAEAFKLPPENVRILCPFTGGMFGSKGATGAHTLLAALAARRLQRPVKIVLSRPQVLTDVGHRSETVQHL
jgi:xanthine dehydrogenase YagR molybdenum-binding subunit